MLSGASNIYLTIFCIIIIGCLCGVNSAPATITCTEHFTPVSDGLPLLPTYYDMAGTLCVPSGFSETGTLLVLVPGATYTQLYWNFSLPNNDYYNFRLAMNNAGYATYTVDRLGTGRSDKPLLGVTVSLQAKAVHTVISELKNNVMDIQFGKIALAGHSLGSAIAIFYYFNHNPVDVDGVIITGAAHWLSVLDIPEVIPTLIFPCQLDPVVSLSPECSLGYVTTVVGARDDLFYHPPTTDPLVLAKDEATKSVVSFTEVPGAIFGFIGPLTVTIDDCTDEQAVHDFEKPYYHDTPDFQAYVLQDAGHDVNLATNTHLYQQRVVNWLSNIIDL